MEIKDIIQLFNGSTVNRSKYFPRGIGKDDQNYNFFRQIKKTTFQYLNIV